jgi:very-short-patch-repair endonuclease
MVTERPIGTLSRLSADSLGVFRGRAAVALGVSRKQLFALVGAGVLERELPDVYRMTVVRHSSEQRLRAALIWAGDTALAGVLSAGELYDMEGVRAPMPEIIVPKSSRVRSARVIVHHRDDVAALMVRRYRALRVTGVEATIVALAHALDAEAFEIACEDARRRRLTSVPALRTYLDRFGRRGLPGVAATRDLLDDLDPVNPARSTLEVKTRRLLVANGFGDFTRESPLEWGGRMYRYDFCFPHSRTILETNGRRWHDDAVDYEDDNDKWSVPGRHGYRMVLATWAKVVRHPDDFLCELTASIAHAA